jgi:RNA polymerase sigma-70 factor (ECF subfamily)
MVAIGPSGESEEVEPLDIEALFERGRAAWPSLALDRAAFERHVADLAAKGDPPLAEHAADLFLACACATGVRGAVEAFEAAFRATILRAVQKVDASPEFVEEAGQDLRIRLFVRSPPKVAAYGGRAKMSTWLTTVTMRSALNFRAAVGDRAADALDSRPVAAPIDVEREYVRERYRRDFQAAVAAATTRLTTRERSLLRLHLGERMSIDRLAVVYGVGRSTTARWVAAARGKLLDEARAELEARFGVSPSELVEVGADLRSALEVSLVRLLHSVQS